MILNGAWAVDQADQRALSELGNVLIEFEEDGRLTYIVRGKDKDQIIKLRYRIEGTTIITDQPSVPQVERTQFSLGQDGVLTLEFGGTPYRFLRAM